MKMPKSMPTSKTLLPLIVILFMVCPDYALGEIKNEGTSKGKDGVRADAITIDSMEIIGSLEKPPVVFLHDRHTNMEKDNLDCTTCHKKVKERLSSKFMRLEDTSRQAVMDIYHDNCLGCHKETAAEGKKTGPIVCGECHRETPKTVSSRQPMGFDKSLHYRHSEAYEKKCEACHADCITAKHEKGNETTCRHCHKQTASESNKVSLKLAVHASCIDCHLKKQAEHQTAGPVKCYGCHDLESRKKIERISPVPRMDRKQPDMVMVRTGNKALDIPDGARMNFVPFNHKLHEEKQETCRVCHHAAMDSCTKCHTTEGAKEGNNIKLEKAMHRSFRSGAEQSCQGCHEMKQQEKNCAGCHAFLSRGSIPESTDQTSCKMCHMNPLPDTEGLEDAAVAEKLLASRKGVYGTYEPQDIPEHVVIKAISSEYQPAEFPHRKIVQKIMDGIKDNRLAAYLHGEQGTICKGCHHNSPASKKPVRCGSCHGTNPDVEDVFKPGMKAAYHIQCIECHQNMGIEKTGCTDCHKKKEVS